MPGTKQGGKTAADTNRKRHGADFYKRIGAMGGRNGHTGGFYANRELARTAGAKAGKVSKKGMKFVSETGGVRKYVAHGTGKVVSYHYDSESKKYERVD